MSVIVPDSDLHGKEPFVLSIQNNLLQYLSMPGNEKSEIRYFPDPEMEKAIPEDEAIYNGISTYRPEKFPHLEELRRRIPKIVESMYTSNE